MKTVDEFKGMKPEDVVKYIEGEPSISVVPVEPGLANMEKTDATGQRIVGLNTENAEINEGLVRFDIIFYVRMPSVDDTKNGLSQIIVNIEAQKDEPTEYKILNRAIFYVSRLISSQKERDFVNTNYDDIKQVFSIWICMNMDDNSLSHIHLTKDEMLKPCTWKGNLDLLNIVLIGITNEIPEHDEKYEMHRLIGALLSSELKEQEKLDIIEHEYNIPISQEFREDVRIMCNLSTGIEERATERATKKATEKTSEKFILNMYKKGYTLDQIADVAETGVDEQASILLKNKEEEMATVILSLHAKQPKRGTISFDKGYVEIFEYPRGMEAKITYTADGHCETISAGQTKDALLYEVEDMEKAIEGDKALMHLDYTKDVMKIMTDIRKSWGMKYPEEE